MSHPDLAAEQAHVNHAYEQLEAMRANALEMLRAAFGERGGTFQALTERDIRVRTSLNRLEQLQLGRESLVFGRIDRLTPVTATVDDGGGGDGDGDGNGEGEGVGDGGASGAPAAVAEAFHIGRLAVADEDQEPLVVDWRAPVAEPFYRATGAQPMGLTRRRHFLTSGRSILDLEDELFAHPEADDDDLDDEVGRDGGSRALSSGGLGAGLSGSAALLAALERSRTGRMRDIVATVQREQDEIIRSPLSGILVVQGGPGTGKTAVALHRAAYLLYTYRFPLESQGVLVVGPNPLFLRYIEHVLPSLGETGVEMSTVGGLFGPIGATGVDDHDTARLKGDPRMARFLARAIADRERPLRRPVTIPFGSQVLTLTPQASADIVHTAKRRSGTHNARRRLVEAMLWRQLHARYAEGRARGRVPSGLEGPGAVWSDEPAGGERTLPVSTADTDITPVELGNELRRVPAVAQALERMWPVLSPQEFLHDLFGAPPLIALAARSLLTPDEQQVLSRARSVSPESVAWTEADLALLDEARALLGSPRRKKSTGGRNGDGGEDDDLPRAYGHIVVDEAQDLSPMQLRMLGRRSLAASMTIVGDIAQATGEWAPASWQEVLAHLPSGRGSRVVELTVNYRTPSEIMDLAGRVLEAAAPGMVAPESVRTTGVHPRVEHAGAGSLAERAAAVAADEAAIVWGETTSGGTVGVICPPSLTVDLGAALRTAGVSFGTLESGALDDTVTLVPVQAVKGLEFDSVVVVEPARIVAESPQGLRALYVALTRATRRLAIVHAEPLPEALAG